METNRIGNGTTTAAELSVIDNRKLTYAPLRIAQTKAVCVMVSHPLSSPGLNSQTVHLYLSQDEFYEQSSMHQIHTVGFHTQSKHSQNQFSNLEAPAKLVRFRCTTKNLRERSNIVIRRALTESDAFLAQLLRNRSP
jgi:hypothetical protein